ncbi:hypothetical protein BMF94_4725 [Rhodotorula taiwanensis]|uniref:Glycosyltransferase family 32 protein n=1 Tax=Rhodotorula taiwanensis TaxID=741276 RepID=A0A2S5B620_9BASI|nr:hypothetical protein BMF94_4725 [Rhodotorula taiwanensis]
MPTHSPLPSFHNSPANTPPRVHSPVFFGSSSNSPSGAVAEKVALSYQRARSNMSGGMGVSNWFQAVRIPIGSSSSASASPSSSSKGGFASNGGVGGGARRELSIPVLKFLHPSRPLPFFSSRPSLKRTPAISSSRYDPRGSGHFVFRLVFAVVGTACVFFLAFASSLRLFHATLSAGRSGAVHIPFVDPSTLVFTPAEIERVWRWEIASGHYPSRRSTPGVSFDLAEGGGGVADRQQHLAMPIRLENPGLPRKTEEDLRRERIVKAEVERRLRSQAGGKGGAAAGDDKDGSSSSSSPALDVVPIGPVREYLDLPIPGSRQSHAYPPRPDSRAAIDLDAVMDHCDFTDNKYVRDCLEILRVNGGMETPLRRGAHDAWKATYIPTISHGASNAPLSSRTKDSLDRYRHNMDQVLGASSSAFASLVNARQQLTLASQVSPATSSRTHGRSAAQIPLYEPHASHPTADLACDPDFPRLFHIFWAGPFTDKPYSAALSFLFSQHLALDRPIGVDPTRLDPSLCRPQLWIWINPGPASSFPDPRAERRMRDDLARNSWSAPLLHPRFADVVRFRLWNTTEQLDGVSEMRGWREMRLFNSGGVKYGSAGEAKRAVQEANKASPDGLEDSKVVEAERAEAEEGGSDMAASAEAALLSAREAHNNNATAVGAANATEVAAPLPTKHKDELFEMVGSTANKYDRLSVVLSDMARFVLTHRFGGVYLDADTILLRDWTELFNWHGAFAYRWSRLEKYNTAVLKMQRGSALGHFIFRTAVANDLDFHPMTVSRYTKDANLEGLLLRLPDALFDPAWLNTEYYQRDRPPVPYFKRFEDFFDTPKEINAAPVATGFDGFFKGAFSYHFHNFWWIPFDQSRNFPDLGPRFQAGERIARGRLLAAKLAASPASEATDKTGSVAAGPSPTKPGVTRVKSIPTPTSARQSTVRGYKWGDDERDFADLDWSDETVEDDERDLPWSAVLKRTFEAYLRGERPNMYGEYINWSTDDDRDY